MTEYDALVVGAGPAGLSAALVLGRCRRNVLVIDSGEYRNAASHSLHAYLGRDGTPPAALRSAGRAELGGYPTVTFHDGFVHTAARARDRFDVGLANSNQVRGRALLLATGVVDDLPPLQGLHALYGQSVFHCPYCDGWEQRDRALAVYGQGRRGLGLALELTVWSRDLVLFTDGPAGLTDDDLDRLDRNGVAVEERRVESLQGRDGQLDAIRLADGTRVLREAMFFITRQQERSGLAAALGCRFNAEGTVETGDNESTNVPGLFVAGDASRNAQLAIVAAAEGAQAAAAINTMLLRQDLK